MSVCRRHMLTYGRVAVYVCNFECILKYADIK